MRDIAEVILYSMLVLYFVVATIALIVGMGTAPCANRHWNMPAKYLIPTYALGCWLVTPIGD